MEFSVILVGTDQEQRAVLQVQVDATAVARVVQSLGAYPVAATDPGMRRIQEASPDIVIVDLARNGAAEGVRAIELFRAELPSSTVIAFGDTSQPQTIIGAMRAGAREFLERPTSTATLLEAFVRLTSASRKSTGSRERGKIFTFLSSKGGAGATTVAVNTALHLQKIAGRVVLVDLAPLPHAALHLNVRPMFSARDALRNAQKLDHALLESYLTPAAGGVQLLAGTGPFEDGESNVSDHAKLLDVLASHFPYVLIDASCRFDPFIKLVCELSNAVLLVAQPDMTSLWSAAKLHESLAAEMSDTARFRLVMNRFRKIPGLSESDIQATTKINTTYRIPNSYNLVSASIQRGIPLVTENHSEISHSFLQLASALAEKPVEKARKSFSLFGA